VALPSDAILLHHALAAQVFDKDDIGTRGIMPLAIVIFNDNVYLECLPAG
jgi:hypothetical protein